MDYILTTKPIEFSGFKVVRSVSEIEKVTMKTTLIVDSYDDKDFDFAVFLVNAVRDKALNKLAYITEKPVRIIMELMRVVGAYVVQDESLIDNSENFSVLLEFLQTNTVSTSTEDLDSLADSFTVLSEYLGGSLEGVPRAERRKVEFAFNKLSDTVQDVLLSDELSQQIQNFLLSASSRVRVAEEDLAKKEADLESLKASSFGGFGGGISAYTQFTYTGNAKVLVIKEQAPTRYLTSFLIAYVSWLSRVPELNAKLIVVEQDSDFVDKRYGEMVKVDAKTIERELGSLYIVQNMFTTTPTQSVMSQLMSPTIDLYVVLDRTYKRMAVVTGRGIHVVNAVSSRRLMRDLGLKSGETIVNDAGEKSQLATLGLIESYPMDEGSRIVKQTQAFERAMRNLTEYCGYAVS